MKCQMVTGKFPGISVEKMPEMDFYTREDKRSNVQSQYSLKTKQTCPLRVSLISLINSIWFFLKAKFWIIYLDVSCLMILRSILNNEIRRDGLIVSPTKKDKRPNFLWQSFTIYNSLSKIILHELVDDNNETASNGNKWFKWMVL